MVPVSPSLCFEVGGVGVCISTLPLSLADPIIQKCNLIFTSCNQSLINHLQVIMRLCNVKKKK